MTILNPRDTIVTNFPHMMALIFNKETDSTMLDFDDINRILAEMTDNGMVEPIDDQSIQTDFYDWADVVGINDQIEADVEFT